MRKVTLGPPGCSRRHRDSTRLDPQSEPEPESSRFLMNEVVVPTLHGADRMDLGSGACGPRLAHLVARPVVDARHPPMHLQA